MRRYTIIHNTEYGYQEPVHHSINIAYAMPRATPWQRVIAEQVEIRPNPTVQKPETDCYGNRRLWFQIAVPHTRLVVQSVFQVEVEEADSFTPMEDELPIHLPREEFLYSSPHVPFSKATAEFAEATCGQYQSPEQKALALMHRISEEFEFKAGATDIGTKPDQLLQLRKGVCQDFTHLALACLRQQGVPARYTSGYLETHPAPGKQKLRGTDASHAWVSFHDGTTWREFDPTNNLYPCRSHVVAAYGRDYADITPVRGILDGGGDQTLKVSVDVERM